MRAFAEVLGPGSADAAAGLLLFFDDARYVFECGDGTQRYCTERGVRLTRLRGLYLTSLAAPSVGGLLGMVLTIADAGKEQVTVAGPRGLTSVFNAAQRNGFCYRPAMDTRIVDVSMSKSGPAAFPATRVVCDDENVRITAVPIPTVNATALATLSYVCRLRDIPGKFNPVRAAELGVKKGPDYGRLSKGNAITVASGVIVRPENVMSPNVPGPLIVIAACPSPHHVHGVVRNPALCPVALGVAVEDDSDAKPQQNAPVCVIYHRSPRSALVHPDYVEWVRRFGPKVSHVTLHSSLAPDRIVFAAQASDLDQLHKYDSRRFRPPWQSVREDATSGQPTNNTAIWEGSAEQFLSLLPSGRCVPREETTASADVGDHDKADTGVSFQAWRVGDCGQQYLLAPVDSSGFCVDDIPPRFISMPNAVAACKPGHDMELWKKFVTTDEPRAATGESVEQEDMETPACVSQFDRVTGEVCFLGTAGAIPGKHRNVSGILLNMFARGCVLLDCGEGTWGQMTRSYGIERASEMIVGLKIVFISHIHADHHLGLLTLLHARQEAISALGDGGSGMPELVVIGPSSLGAWLDAYEEALLGEQHGLPGTRSFKFMDAVALTEPQHPESRFFADSFGLDIACVDVVHCPRSYGIVIADCVKQWKVVYSGDTRPCRALAKAGLGATLAIHEATLDDSMSAEAVSKNHSTTSEALTVCGEWMGAWRTVLTHFSQRYPRVPVLDAAAVSALKAARAAVAFDFMRVNFADLHSLPLTVPAVREAFPKDLMVPGGHEASQA
jgi:ribonuclease Z